MIEAWTSTIFSSLDVTNALESARKPDKQTA